MSLYVISQGLLALIIRICVYNKRIYVCYTHCHLRSSNAKDEEKRISLKGS